MINKLRRSVLGAMIGIRNNFSLQVRDQAGSPSNNLIGFIDHFVVADEKKHRSLNLTELLITEHVRGKRIL